MSLTESGFNQVPCSKVVITEELIGLKKGYLKGEVTSNDKYIPW